MARAVGTVPIPWAVQGAKRVSWTVYSVNSAFFLLFFVLKMGRGVPTAGYSDPLKANAPQNKFWLSSGLWVLALAPAGGQV